jgi:hypothetical protein
LKNNTILDEAKEIIYGDREQTYGHPAKNLNMISSLWSNYLGIPIGAQDVCMMMILLKVSRQSNAYTRDNLVDIAGYAALNSRLEDDA